ncbi:MAG: hypothetical protein QW279_04475, partial [Candidatus Jordarchaeaceae archaeon]
DKTNIFWGKNITARAIILITIGALGILSIWLIKNYVLPETILTFELVQVHSLATIVLIPPPEIKIVSFFNIINIQSAIEKGDLINMAVLLVSGLILIDGIGLLFKKKWAYYLGKALLYLAFLVILIICIMVRASSRVRHLCVGELVQNMGFA